MNKIGTFTNPLVQVEYQGRSISFDLLEHPIQVGRSEQCDVPIHEARASRIHLHLINEEGQIMIEDMSTNGSWIKSANGREFFLRHEKIQLPQSGLISFGIAFHENPQYVLGFQIEKSLDKHE